MISALFLLRLKSAETNKSQIINSIILGILSALALLTRLNGGLALFVASNILILIMARRHRFKLASLATFCFIATIITVITIIGDSISDWILFSILGGISAKGGTTHLLLTPLLLPWNAAKSILAGEGLVVLLQLALLTLLPYLLTTTDKCLTEYGVRKPYRITMAIALLILGYRLVSNLRNTDPIVFISAVFVWIAYISIIISGVRFSVSLLKNKMKSICESYLLLLLPVLLWITGALSSAGYHYGLYFPFAFFLLLLPLSSPQIFKSSLLKSIFITLCALLAFFGFSYRYENPCSWHNYRSYPLFENRIILKHPLYDPTIIDKDLHAFFSRVYSTITYSGGDLLSIPFPFANYYCGISPWNNYVQTFFDTSNAKVINQLITQLQKKPPKWILYQRQPENLKNHERVFNSGKPLPHRDLDIFLMKKLRNRQWSIAIDTYFSGDRWILICTQ
jgi:hypothetical protein